MFIWYDCWDVWWVWYQYGVGDVVVDCFDIDLFDLFVYQVVVGFGWCQYWFGQVYVYFVYYLWYGEFVIEGM